MKEGWQIKTIGDVCTIISGQSPESNSYNDDRIGMPFYQGKKDFSEKYLSNPTNWTSSPTKESVYGDILMSVRAPVGSININHIGTICIGRGLAAIRTHNEQINSNYLYYYLESIHNAITGKEGAVFPSINKDGIITIPLPLPPLSEQQRIVDILDREFAKIDAVKSNAEQALQNAKDLFQATLQKTLQSKEGWNKRLIKGCCSFIRDGSHNPPKRVSLSDYYMLSSLNVQNNKLTYDDAHCLSKECFVKENDRTKVKKGDVLLTIVGARLGRSCVYDSDKHTTFQRSVAILTPSPDVDSSFLMYSLIVMNIIKFSQGAAQPGVYLKQISNLPFCYPDLTIQKNIVKRITTYSGICGQVESNTKQIIAQCEALKQALLRKAFNGEL